MTEEQIECAVERKMDRLDSLFMRGAISQEQYNASVAELSRWADSQYTSPFFKRES